MPVCRRRRRPGRQPFSPLLFSCRKSRVVQGSQRRACARSGRGSGPFLIGCRRHHLAAPSRILPHAHLRHKTTLTPPGRCGAPPRELCVHTGSNAVSKTSPSPLPAPLSAATGPACTPTPPHPSCSLVACSGTGPRSQRRNGAAGREQQQQGWGGAGAAPAACGAAPPEPPMASTTSLKRRAWMSATGASSGTAWTSSRSRPSPW